MRLQLKERLGQWWGRNIIGDAPPFTDDEHERWKARSEHYVRCEDSDCSVAYAYRAEGNQPHWHFIGGPTHARAEVPGNDA